MRILNRVITITKDGVQYEADPRHAELMIRNLSLGESTGVDAPGAKPTDWALEVGKEGAPEPWDNSQWLDGTEEEPEQNTENSCGPSSVSSFASSTEAIKLSILQDMGICAVPVCSVHATCDIKHSTTVRSDCDRTHESVTKSCDCKIGEHRNLAVLADSVSTDVDDANSQDVYCDTQVEIGKP